METKSEKFRRLRDLRVAKATKAIDLIANLAGRDYEYSAVEARAIVSALEVSVDAVAVCFDVEPPAPEEAIPATYDPRWSDLTVALEALNDGDVAKAKSLIVALCAA